MDCGMMGFPPSSPPPHPLCRLSVRPSVRPSLGFAIAFRARTCRRATSELALAANVGTHGRKRGREDCRAPNDQADQVLN